MNNFSFVNRLKISYILKKNSYDVPSVSTLPSEVVKMEAASLDRSSARIANALNQSGFASDELQNLLEDYFYSANTLEDISSDEGEDEVAENDEGKMFYFLILSLVQ